jgi:hypothetical protein
MDRQFFYYDPAHLDGNKSTNTTMMVQKGNETQQDIQEYFKFNKIMVPTIVKLPYPVQQQFADPYRMNQPGFELVAFPHETDATRFFYVFSCCVKDSALPQQVSQSGFRVRMWGQQQPPAQQQPPPQQQQGQPQQQQAQQQGQQQQPQQQGQGIRFANQGPQNMNVQP